MNNELLSKLLNDVRALKKVGGPGDPTGRRKNPFKSREVPLTEEFLRIAGLERRDWEPEGELLADRLTPLLASETGTQRLRPIQAMTLYELWQLGFAICIARVGGGKTLPTFLAPYVTKSLRPLLVVPANLLEKTERDLVRYRQHWKIPGFIRLESYEKISSIDNEDILTRYKPDLIMLDEASKAKNQKAKFFTILDYYKHDCDNDPDFPKDLKWLLCSGTFTDCSLADYVHLLRLVMPYEKVPLPWPFPEYMQWRLAIDEDVGELSRIKPGALLNFCTEEEKRLVPTNSLKAVRRGYRSRFISTPGIISSSKAYLGCSLRITPVEVEVPENIVKAFWKLRRKFITPDGQELQDAHVIARHAKILATGMYLRWNPMPPPEYVEAFQLWSKKCRRKLKYTEDRIDSEGQLIRAIQREGKYPELRDILEAWLREHQKFGKPNVEAVWVDDYAINFAAKWMEKNPGIVWVYHPEFGRRLAKKTGVEFYWKKGFDESGKFIEDHKHGTPMIAGINPNREGKNLQDGWSANLIMHPPRRNGWWEQLLGRTHRDGQRADEVFADVFTVCRESVEAFWKACAQAEYVLDASDPPPKLLFASHNMQTLEQLDARQGALWRYEEGILDADDTDTGREKS